MFIAFDLREPELMVTAIGRCQRGDMTVNELTGINDRKVMEERADKLKDYQIIRDSMRIGNEELNQSLNERLQKFISPRSDFSRFAIFYFHKEGCI